jgi:hypothetical protein
MGDVHRDFHAESKVDRLRSFPLHDELLAVNCRARPGRAARRTILTKARRRRKGIIMNRAS